MSASLAVPSVTGAGARWSDFRKRVLSALVLGPLALAAVWAGAWPFRLMVAAAAAVLAWEWVHLCGLMTRRWPGMVVPGVLLLACLAAALEQPLAALAALAAGFALALAAAPPAAPPAGRPGAGRRWLAAGVPYVGIGCIALIGLRGDGTAPLAQAGLGNVLFLLAVVWASDIGAYAAGRLLGGPNSPPPSARRKPGAGRPGAWSRPCWPASASPPGRARCRPGHRRCWPLSCWASQARPATSWKAGSSGAAR